MSTRRLRYFVRIDATGNIVPGSLIARRKEQGHPKSVQNGSWMEVMNPKCCPDVVVTYTALGTPSGLTDVTVTGNCGSTQLFTYTVASDSYADTVSKLNTNFPGVATWSNVGAVIKATAPICSAFTFTVGYV